MFPIGTVLLIVFMLASTLLALVHTHQPARATSAPGSFTFTAAGDYSQTKFTTANLQYIARSGASFNLALGDFNYVPTVTQTDAINWSNYAKANLGTVPFEILVGGHDPDQISTYEANLPNKLSGVTGTYGEQYSFDYPTGAPPLARFILISPSHLLPGYSYTVGSAGYNWLKGQIDSARIGGIHWIIVGMHQYCFVIGTASCTSTDLLNLLLNEKVDLVLEAQKHDYQASKQLALNSSTCPTVSMTSYNGGCVVNSTSSFAHGAGSVFVVSGTGGASPQLAVNTSDPKIGYFRNYNGSGTNTTWGVSQFSISATSLTENFVPVTNTAGSGNFTDSFTIAG